ncbi:MAG: hypothetical protein AB7R90_19355 [Reyranellaceae bacterium]
MRSYLTALAALAAFDFSRQPHPVVFAGLDAGHAVPTRGVQRRSYQSRSKYTPAMVRALGAERGVGRPPAVLAKWKAREKGDRQ